MSRTYFNKLNYTLANEDTRLEYEMVKQTQAKRVLTVCGSGGRSLPLICGSEEVVCTDLSQEQLWLAEHRAETFKTLNWKEFLLYWGFSPFSTKENKGVRKEMFECLKLKSEIREYFSQLYDSLDYQGLIYEGSWEKTFTGVPKLLRRVVGKRYDNIFNFETMEEQKAFFDAELKKTSWVMIPRLVLRAFGNAAFFNALLYKGHFVNKNMPESHYEIYRKAYRSLFYQGLTKENFFLQLTFLGWVKYAEGNTIEAHEDIFNEIKHGVTHRPVSYLKEDLVTVGENSQEKFDFVSLSDVPSYFSAQMDQVYLQRLSHGLNPGALVVVRCYLRIPEQTNLEGFADVTKQYQHLIDQEKTQIYKTFVYQFQG